MGTIVRECPRLQGPRGQPCTRIQPVFISSGNVDNLLFSTCNTAVGTLVTIGCLGPQREPSPSPYIYCQPDGSWNSSVPVCLAPVTRSPPSGEQLSLETRIIIGVVCGFAALVLLIILTLSLVYYMKVKRSDKRNRSLDLPETDFYWRAPISKRPDSVRSNMYQTEINPMYSTRLWRPSRPDSVRSNMYQTEINPMYSTRLWRPSYLHRYSSGYYSSPARADRAPPPPPPSLPPPPPPSPPPLPPPQHPERRHSVASSTDRWYPGARPAFSTDLYKTIIWRPENMKWHDTFNYSRDGRLPRYHMDERGLYRGTWRVY